MVSNISNVDEKRTVVDVYLCLQRTYFDVTRVIGMFFFGHGYGQCSVGEGLQWMFKGWKEVIAQKDC